MQGLAKNFEDSKNPQVVGRCDHLLLDIVTIAILAVIGGADDGPDVETFGERRESWLRKFLKLPNAIPSHDTFRRVFESLNRKQLAKCLFEWTQALQKASTDKVIATETGLTLGQIACEDKSNEITAMSELQELLDHEGATVTPDATRCQRAIAEQIRSYNGNHLLGLKGDHSGLLAEMQTLFEHGVNTDFEGDAQNRVFAQ